MGVSSSANGLVEEEDTLLQPSEASKDAGTADERDSGAQTQDDALPHTQQQEFASNPNKTDMPEKKDNDGLDRPNDASDKKKKQEVEEEEVTVIPYVGTFYSQDVDELSPEEEEEYLRLYQHTPTKTTSPRQSRRRQPQPQSRSQPSLVTRISKKRDSPRSSPRLLFEVVREEDENEEGEDDGQGASHGMGEDQTGNWSNQQGQEDENGTRWTGERGRTTFRRLSRQFSQSMARRRSSIEERLPKTPSGWAILLSAIGATVLAYEIQLQQSLTAPPLVFGQCCDTNSNNASSTLTTNTGANRPDKKEPPLYAIYRALTKFPHSILRRTIQPSLFVGTRGLLASTAAYLVGGPGATERHLRFREIMPMTMDGAQVGIDWELPPLHLSPEDMKGTRRSQEEERRKNEILHGPISTSVVLILHGINNDANFGYVRSLMRACCDKGWVAAGMNFRGCGGVPMTTPRGYNGGYTGDLRCVVQRIVSRLAPNGAYLCIVGNSLGANLVGKYLGEEGLSGTLPDKVVAGITLGNPMFINSAKIEFPYGPLLALGIKKSMIENWSNTWPFFKHDQHFRNRALQSLAAIQIKDCDIAMAPLFARSDPLYPFGFRVGHKDGSAYWNDASSYRLIRFIPVPTLQIMAADDMLCYNNFKGAFAYSLANPNVMMVETRCGGHLGWQESPPPPPSSEANKTNDENSSSWKRRVVTALGGGGSTSWANVATTDFIEAVLELKVQQEQEHSDQSLPSQSTGLPHCFQGHILPTIPSGKSSTSPSSPMNAPLIRSRL